MTLTIPDFLATAIQREVELGGAPLKKQIRALEELFDLFTTGRSGVGQTGYLDKPKLRGAYLRYHVPLNFVRASCALSAVRKVAPQIDALEHVIDLGAGPGTASLAAASVLPPLGRAFELYDKSRAALRLASELAAAGRSETEDDPARRSTWRVHQHRLPALPEISEPALVLAAMVLNELRLGERRGVSAEEFALALTESLPAGSIALLIEPAQRGPGRNLLALRDALLAEGGWRVLAPCTHAEPCPLLDLSGRPWCHFHFEWRVPPYVERIAAPLGLCERKGPTKASLAFLAIERTGDRKPSTSSTRGGRAIGDPMRVFGKKTGIYLCREGRRDTLKLREHEVERGDVVDAPGGGVDAKVLLPWNDARPGAARRKAGAKPAKETRSGAKKRGSTSRVGKKRPKRGPS